MAIEVGDVLRVAVQFKWDDLFDIVNVWHVVASDLGTAADDSEVMVDIEEAVGNWYLNMIGAIADNCQGAQLSGVNVTKDELLPVTPFNFAPATIAESLPLTTTPMMQFGSATPRHGSRIYLPPVIETYQADGIMTSVLLDILADMAADMLLGFTGTSHSVDFERVAYDRIFGVARSLISALVPVELRTQRRRRRQVGS